MGGLLCKTTQWSYALFYFWYPPSTPVSLHTLKKIGLYTSKDAHHEQLFALPDLGQAAPSNFRIAGVPALREVFLFPSQLT